MPEETLGASLASLAELASDFAGAYNDSVAFLWRALGQAPEGSPRGSSVGSNQSGPYTSYLISYLISNFVRKYALESS